MDSFNLEHTFDDGFDLGVCQDYISQLILFNVCILSRE